MNLSELKKAVEENSKKKIGFVLPDGSRIPSHFHITEVGHVRKDFIDCGGTQRSVSACLLQAWVAVNDEDHSLEAAKLAGILNLAGKILPNDELPVEVEFEAPLISQFPIDSVQTTPETVIFHLSGKHTDCLAKEQCGLENATSGCSPSSGCC